MICFKKIVKLQILIFCALAFYACSITKINISHTTPKKPFKYPVFTLKDTLRGQLNRFRSCYDVYFYNLNIDIDINTRSISGFTDMCFDVIKDFDTLQVDLYNNMLLDSIIYEGRKLTFYRLYDAVFVKIGQQLNAPDKKNIRVYYHGKPSSAAKPPWEGGFVWSRDKNKKPWVGVACEVDGASLWWPVKDHLSDEPDSMKLSFTIPTGLMCVSNGHITDSISINGKTAYTWKVSYPINTYNATFYIGDFRHFIIPYKGIDTSFNLDFYVLPYNLYKAQIHFQQTTDILHFYESVFGPYPWPRDGYKLVESPYMGMENQTAIAYGNEYKNYFNSFDYIILHETAHEWWGNSITVPDYAEVWIQEGFATYSEALYIENKLGHQAYLNYINFYATFIRNKRPVIGPHDVNYWDYKDVDVYLKGALTLHTLRNTLANDSVFFDILKSFYNLYKYKFAVTRNFIDLVNQKTGKDYNCFFNQYLYNRESPVLQWKFSYNPEKKSNEFSFRWSNVCKDFSMPIKIKTEKRTFDIKPTTNLQILDLSTDETLRINTDKSYISLKKGF